MGKQMSMLIWDKEKYRPLPFYFLNQADDSLVSREAIREALGRLKSAGYGGCVVFNKPPDGFTQEEFLGPKWFQTIRYFAEEALTLGLEIWINDGFNFPPGDAGGRIHEIAPQLGQKRLSLNADRSVSIVDVPWCFPAFEEPESSKLFIEFVYEGHKKYVGEFFGRSIVGFFSDADNRRVPHGALEGKYFPWSHGFPSGFEKALGYSIIPHLPDILGGKDCKEAVDYWRFAGRLYQQWFANNHEWCRKNKLKYTFHSSDSGPRSLDETNRSSIFTEGDAFELHSHADFPGTDHELRALHSGTPFFPKTLWHIESALWGEPNELVRSPEFSNVLGDVRAKLASSAAFLYGRERAMCECFAATNWSCEPDELRRIALWQIMQGINFFVPHAAHHRFGGATKYFAPPELLRYGVLAKSMRELNDHLAELCAIASSGELIAPIALLDPTEEMWRTGKAFIRFFKLCAELNRLPYGYVIVPKSALLGRQKEFLVTVNPGMNLSEDDRNLIRRTGTILLEEDELARLVSLIQLDFAYEGNGRPHFMRRKVDGGELLLVANIEEEGRIVGKVTYEGKSHAIELLPGELAIFAPGLRRYRKPAQISRRLTINGPAKLEWGGPNSITMFRWEDAGGDAQSIASNYKELFFRWKTLEALPSLRLLVPATAAATYSFDGVALESGRGRLVFDEEYLEFDLNDSGAKGEHVIKLSKDQALSAYSPFYLEGDFDSDVLKVPDGILVPALDYYSFSLKMPQHASVFLKKRRSELDTNRSWAEQGQLFYSGAASYSFEFTIPAEFKQPCLRFGRVACRLGLRVNGLDLGCRIFPPFDFDLKGFSGPCRAELRVENTMGNMLDGYGAPSGLLASPELLDMG